MNKILFVVSCFWACTTVHARTYFVSSKGNDDNNGLSPRTAWKSLAKVSSTIFLAGDTILFKSGEVWTGEVAPKGSGSKTNPIVVGKYGRAGYPRIDGRGGNDSKVFSLIDQSFWVVTDLEITNRQLAGGNARLTGIYVGASKGNSLSDIRIRHCFVHDVGSVSDEKDSNFSKGCGGIILTGQTNEVLIEDCHIKDVSVEGIRNSSDIKCSHIVINRNLIENVYGDGIVLHGVKNRSAITHNILRNTCYNTSLANYAGAWTYLSDSTRIAYNEVSGITGGGRNDGQPFDADIAVNGDVFEYNYTHDNAKGFMLFMPSAKNVVVRFNLSVNDIQNGSGNQRLFNYTVRRDNSNNKIYNNTFYISSKVDYLFQGGFKGEFSNNIIACADTVYSFANKPIGAGGAFMNNYLFPFSITSINGPNMATFGLEGAFPCFKMPEGANKPRAKVQKDYSLCTDSPLRRMGRIISDNGGLDFTGRDISGDKGAVIGAIW